METTLALRRRPLRTLLSVLHTIAGCLRTPYTYPVFTSVFYATRCSLSFRHDDRHGPALKTRNHSDSSCLVLSVLYILSMYIIYTPCVLSISITMVNMIMHFNPRPSWCLLPGFLRYYMLLRWCSRSKCSHVSSCVMSQVDTYSSSFLGMSGSRPISYISIISRWRD